MATVTIKYTAPKAAEEAVKVGQISPMFDLTNSYVDEAVIAEQRKDDAMKRIPAENKFGFEGLDMKVPAKIGIPYPNGVGTIDIEKLGTESEGTYTYTFEVTDMDDIVYYQTRAKDQDVIDAGFEITVDPS